MFVHLKPKPDWIKTALESVPDPRGNGSLIATGTVSAVEIGREAVTVILEIDPALAAAYEAVRVQVEQAVLQVKRVKAVRVVLTAERKPEPQGAARSAPVAGGGLHTLEGGDPGAAGRTFEGAGHEGQGIDGMPTRSARPAPQEGPVELPHVGHVIAVASGKGGVGKSTVAANLAAALTRKGLKAGILDADIFGPSVPTMFAAQDVSPAVEGGRFKPVVREGIALMSSGFMVHGRTPIVWRGPMVHKALIQMVRDVDWGMLDVLIVDMPPGTGDVALTLAKYAPFDGAVVVTTPQDVALADVRKGIEMFRKLDIPVIGIVENMSVFCCPHCGKTTDIFGSGGADAEAAESGVPVLGRLTLYPQVRAAADAGKPIVLAAPHDPATSEYLGLAQAVMDGLAHGEMRGPVSSRGTV